MNKEKLEVSILCSTYNHKNYIRQALDGFLMQKTKFGFEVLINDDGSNDDTVGIVNEYAKKYPNIIKPYFQKENLYSKGYRNMMMRFLFPKAKGKYIALCEGDDYWTNPEKLQNQVDFLEKNKDYALCFHSVKVTFENNSKPDSVYPDRKKTSEFTVDKLLRGNYIQTNSVMYRRQNYKNLPFDVMPGDWYLHLYHAQFGKIDFINKVMGVYRRHEEGLWWNSYANKEKLLLDHGLMQFNLYLELLKIYKLQNHRRIIYESIATLLGGIMNLKESKSKEMLKEITGSHSEELTKMVVDLNRNSIQLHQGYNQALKERNEYKDELNKIKSTKGWKLLTKYYNLRKKINLNLKK